MVNPEEWLIREERERLLIAEARAACSPRQWRILVQIYGLEGEEPQSMPALAVVYGVSKERIKHYRNWALQRARKPVKRAAALL